MIRHCVITELIDIVPLNSLYCKSIAFKQTLVYQTQQNYEICVMVTDVIPPQRDVSRLA